MMRAEKDVLGVWKSRLSTASRSENLALETLMMDCPIRAAEGFFLLNPIGSVEFHRAIGKPGS